MYQNKYGKRLCDIDVSRHGELTAQAVGHVHDRECWIEVVSWVEKYGVEQKSKWSFPPPPRLRGFWMLR